MEQYDGELVFVFLLQRVENNDKQPAAPGMHFI